MNSGRLKLLIIFIDINDIELSAWYPKIISYVPRNIKNIKVKINLLDGLSTIDEEDITINEDNEDYAYGHVWRCFFIDEDEYIDKIDAFDFRSFDRRKDDDITGVSCFKERETRHTRTDTEKVWI